MENIKNKGFTIIEMLVVLFIIALISSVIIVTVGRSRADARDAKRRADLSAIKIAVEMYKDRTGTYVIKMRDGTATGGGTANGFFNRKVANDGDGVFDAYENSIANGLEDWGFLNPAPSDPSNPGITVGTYLSYMFIVNTTTEKYAIFATLENPQNPITRTCQTGGACAGSTKIYDGESSLGGICQDTWAACTSNYAVSNGWTRL